ncbi:MAG: hypothetical protein DCC67_00140 [Planctomycetota bacterium]|nr:MAG: hypothetical protein DCC67_00140 [Planctomycetota bacterium]
MLKCSASLPTVDDLVRYIADTLSQLEMLKSDQFKLARRVIRRGGRPCGLYFALHGPRSLCLSAVWETAGNVIYFYGSCGRRVQCTTLLAAPPVQLAVDMAG